MIELICKQPALFIIGDEIQPSSPIVVGQKYHLLDYNVLFERLYFTLVEFGKDFGFEAELFEIVDKTPHYRQWQKELNLN